MGMKNLFLRKLLGSSRKQNYCRYEKHAEVFWLSPACLMVRGYIMLVLVILLSLAAIAHSWLGHSWAKPRDTMESPHDTRTRLKLQVMVEQVVPFLAGAAIVVTCGLRGFLVFMAGRASHSGEVFWSLMFVMVVTVLEVVGCRPRYGEEPPAVSWWHDRQGAEIPVTTTTTENPIRFMGFEL
jgi:hypothetical protein